MTVWLRDAVVSVRVLVRGCVRLSSDAEFILRSKEKEKESTLV